MKNLLQIACQWLVCCLMIPFIVNAPVVQAAETCALTEMGATLVGVDRIFPDFKQNLDSGLHATLVHHWTANGHKHSINCKVYFDLWETVYVIEKRIDSSQVRRTFKSYADVLKQCTMIPAQDMESVVVRTLLNPVETNQVEATRKWLAEKGIAANSNAIIGRAVSAFIDLDHVQSAEFLCQKTP